MHQLEKWEMAHGNLRARNIFMSKRGDHYTPKLSAFGLNNEISDLHNETENAKWTAVEILNGKFFLFIYISFPKSFITLKYNNTANEFENPKTFSLPIK